MRPSHHRVIAVVAAAGVLLAACGAEADPLAGSSTEASSPATTDVAPTAPETTLPTGDLDPPATEPPAPPVTEVPAPEPPPTEPPPAAPPATDPPPPVEAVLGGRALDATLSATADSGTNPLPDLVVDDVGRQAKVNLRNVFPADRPVLIWMWAPH